jgi:hypothetical protein
MELTEIVPGLERWTTAHPEWRAGAEPESPADWPREVGSVLVRTPDSTIFIDALLPPEADAAWRLLDARVDGRDVFALTTIGFHRRSRDALVERYGAATSRARPALPDGIESFPVRGAGETMFWLPEHRTLVPGDRILGAPGGGVRMCPASWLGYLPHAMDLATLRSRLRPLLELPIERVLVSHGAPVLRAGREALGAALS